MRAKLGALGGQVMRRPRHTCGPHLFVHVVEGVVVADDAAGLRPVLVVEGDPVGQVAQRSRLLLDVQDVAVLVDALRPQQRLARVSGEPPVWADRAPPSM